MISNLFKTLNKTYNKSIITPISRYITSQKCIKDIKEQEDESVLKIEANVFDNSSIKYEPIKKEDVLKKQKKIRKNEVNNNVISKSQEFPNFKKTLVEQKAGSRLINDQELGLEFLKLSLNDSKLCSLITTVRSKKKRDKDGQIIIEGRRLILEALMCGLRLNCVIFSQKEELEKIKEEIIQVRKKFDIKIYKVPHHDLKIWSTLTTPPGVMAICERPSSKNALAKTCPFPLPITVVCDNIREPNNLGSIIRTCAALPCQQVVITRGCCDPWESKALRGGCGGQFRLPIIDDVDWAKIPLMIPPEATDNCFIFVAENNLEKLRNENYIAEYTEVENTGIHNIVVIGGETHGVSEDAYRLMETAGQRGKCLYIPLAQGIDSLNVASALTLILYELRKNILKSTNSQQPE